MTLALQKKGDNQDLTGFYCAQQYRIMSMQLQIQNMGQTLTNTPNH